MLTDMHHYNSEACQGTMADLYALAFRITFRDAFASNGKCVTCNSLKRHEKQLKRFKLDCDMGLVHVSIRTPSPGEHWTVSAAEGFLEYLSRKTTVSLLEYGIDVTPIISHVARIAVDLESSMACFVPEVVFSEEWLLSVIPCSPGVLDYIEVDEEILLRMVEEDPVDPCLIGQQHFTKNIALAYLRRDVENIAFIPNHLMLEACQDMCRELWAENAELKKRMAA